VTPAAGPAVPAPDAAARRFITDATTIATREAGDLQGFDTTDVTTRRVPQFVGRVEFEVLPTSVRAGEPFVVRVVLVNEGKKNVRIRSVALMTLVDGRREPASVKPLQREVGPQQRALVAEYSAVWPQPGSWSLEATVTADRDETVTSRLTWM
jgi:hypothetical protein